MRGLFAIGKQASIASFLFFKLKRIRAFSLLLFTEDWMLSGFFLKKKPPLMLSYVNM
jgi:hypothetical protein